MQLLAANLMLRMHVVHQPRHLRLDLVNRESPSRPGRLPSLSRVSTHHHYDVQTFLVGLLGLASPSPLDLGEEFS